ncbi:hypothetical protein NQ314_014180 [Rhamnusium bicolor]|uniref:Uncharacterized protein n=1 Tax=Rhamnusium bicolor TaxID=1586634 RepID=A0AAV8X322_9CUCU|nr:hypothetical protein NQ314_014180 [Rhamnusium bicolor]
MREEHRQYAKKRVNKNKRDHIDIENDNQTTQEDELPPSIAILFSGHEFLGIFVNLYFTIINELLDINDVI